MSTLLLSPLLLLGLACGGTGADTGSGGDTGALSAEDAAFCADAPVVTWDSWGQGFMTEACQTCHASTAVDRHEAPEDVVFDTRDDVAAHRDRILDRSTGESPTMPPRGGVTDDDRQRLEIWLRCWLPQEAP